MAKRLTELYPLGSPVEIYFEVADLWVPGVIIEHQHPAVWVQTADSRRWFVTNSRRVRKAND